MTINKQQAQQRTMIAGDAVKVLAYAQELTEQNEYYGAPKSQIGAAMLLMAAASLAPDRKKFLEAARFIYDELRSS